MNKSTQGSDSDLDRARLVYLNRVLFEENGDQHLIFWVGRSRIDDELRVGIATGFTETEPLDDWRQWEDTDWRDLWDLEQEIEEGVYRLGTQIEEPITTQAYKPKKSFALRLFLIGLGVSIVSAILSALAMGDSDDIPLWGMLPWIAGNLLIIAGGVLFIRDIIRRSFHAAKRKLSR